jgi:hypothetical protein
VSLQAGNEADTLHGAEEGDEGGLEGELLQVALLANFRAGKPEKRKAKKSQKQLYAVESALAQRKRRARTLLTGCRKMKRETTMMVLAYGARQN